MAVRIKLYHIMYAVRPSSIELGLLIGLLSMETYFNIDMFYVHVTPDGHLCILALYLIIACFTIYQYNLHQHMLLSSNMHLLCNEILFLY